MASREWERYVITDTDFDLKLPPLARNIRSHRQKVNLTQRMLADRLGVSQNAVLQWEIGANAPRASRLQDVARELRVSIDELLSGDPNSWRDRPTNAIARPVEEARPAQPVSPTRAAGRGEAAPIPEPARLPGETAVETVTTTYLLIVTTESRRTS